MSGPRKPLAAADAAAEDVRSLNARLRASNFLSKDGQVTREMLTPENMRFFLDRMADRGIPVMSDEDRVRSLETILKSPHAEGEIWVFGYGSLMWNPTLHVADTQQAKVWGFHRAFCLSLVIGRGTPETPGLMLGLDHGGSCIGLAHRLPEGREREELNVLWCREMISGAYRPRWVTAHTPLGPKNAVTFTANPRHMQYAGGLDHLTAVKRIATAHGELGTNRDYLFRMVERLDAMGLKDGPMHILERDVRRMAEDA
jgi:cation transport protein ChaC